MSIEPALTYTVRITNTREDFRCAAAQSVLGAMESLGRRGIPVGCRGGGCGVCKVRVDAGQVHTEAMSRASVSAEEERQGFVLACRARPRSDLTVTAVDRLARCIQKSLQPGPSASFLARATRTVPLTHKTTEGDSSCQ
jgi:ferredoxin